VPIGDGFEVVRQLAGRGVILLMRSRTEIGEEVRDGISFDLVVEHKETLPPTKWVVSINLTRERAHEPVAPVHLSMMLKPYATEEMECCSVSAAVGKVRNDEPGLLEPAAA